MFKVHYLCWLCRQPLAIAHHAICSVCLKQLPPLPSCCPRCGLPAGSRKKACLRCQQQPPLWHTLIAIDDYQPPLSRLISHYKYGKQEQLALLLARLFLLTWLSARRQQQLCKPDRILSVPLHRLRHWQRGFNQTELIVQKLAYWLNCPWSPTTLSRVQRSQIQSRLSAKQRKQNLHNAFACHMPLHDLHIALFDDVVTTGSTIHEICRLLHQQGVASIQIWCLCRTL